MDGLKRHTRPERARVIEALVPAVMRHMEGHLVAMAVAGSFARGTDGPYCNVEIIGFVKKPMGARATLRVVHDGLGIDLWFPTGEEYCQGQGSSLHPAWHHWGPLRPLVNEAFIAEMNAARGEDRPGERMQHLGESWPQLRAAMAALLAAVETGDADAAPGLYWRLVDEVCGALSILNARPFTSRATAFTEAQFFTVRPAAFGQLLSPGAMTATELARLAYINVAELEQILTSEGVKLWESELDGFVQEKSLGSFLRESLRMDGMAQQTGRARPVGAKPGSEATTP